MQMSFKLRRPAHHMRHLLFHHQGLVKFALALNTLTAVKI